MESNAGGSTPQTKEPTLSLGSTVERAEDFLKSSGGGTKYLMFKKALMKILKKEFLEMMEIILVTSNLLLT